MVSRQCLQYKLIPEVVGQIKACLIQKLLSCSSCAVTLDLWTSRRMHGYFGITVHFENDEWKMKSYLLCCKQMKGRHTGESIHMEYESVLEYYDIEEKVFKAVTDNGSNMVKAFNVTFEVLNDVGDIQSHDDDDEEDSDDALTDESTELDESLLLSDNDRIKRFAYTSQLSVKDGIESSEQLTTILSKVCKLVSHNKRSTIAIETLELANKHQVILKNDTRWNSQLKMVRRILELDLQSVVEKNELMLSTHEKAILNSFVLIFEPFEITTDLLHGEHYCSISMALPCYLGIVDNLKKLETTSRYNISVIRCLLSSFETHLGDMLHNPLYCLSSALDSSFKLKWCKTKGDQDKVITMIKYEMDKLTSASTSDKHTVETGGSGCSGSDPPAKKGSFSVSWMRIHQMHQNHVMKMSMNSKNIQQTRTLQKMTMPYGFGKLNRQLIQI